MVPSALASSLAWASFRPATCLPDDCFCEGLRDSLIRQPANTWSSLAFVVVALWIAARLSRGVRSERPVLAGVETGLFLGALVLVGLGSGFYHASLTFIGQVFDVSGMYLVATFILQHRLGPRWNLPPVWRVSGFVLVNGLLMAGQVATPSLRRIVFGALLVAALAVEWRSSRAGRTWLATGAGLMVLAFVIWVVDRERWLCEPGSLIQGHAVWHLLGALAAGCLYRSYEAEAAAS
jgi:predicted membrane channel-forming protein YqfA (hemolysin III family)